MEAMETKMLPNRVRELRENRLMTQAQLARKARVALRTIHSVEKGMACRMDTKRKILLALGMRFEDKDQVFPPLRQRLAEPPLELGAQDRRVDPAGDGEAHRRRGAEDGRAGEGPSDSRPEAQIRSPWIAVESSSVSAPPGRGPSRARRERPRGARIHATFRASLGSPG